MNSLIVLIGHIPTVIEKERLPEPEKQQIIANWP